MSQAMASRFSTTSDPLVTILSWSRRVLRVGPVANNLSSRRRLAQKVQNDYVLIKDPEKLVHRLHYATAQIILKQVLIEAMVLSMEVPSIFFFARSR